MPSNRNSPLIPIVNNGVIINVRPQRGVTNRRHRRFVRRQRCFQHNTNTHQYILDRIERLPLQVVNDPMISQFFNGFSFY